MIHAYILAIYKNPEQVFRLFEKLNTGNTVFVIHISRNSNKSFNEIIRSFFKNFDNVYFCKRIWVSVFRIDIVDAVINAIETLHKNNVSFDYITSLSGQDYPIKSNRQIFEFLKSNQGKEFITYHPLVFDNEADYKNTQWGRKETYRYEDYWIKFNRNGKLHRFPIHRFVNKPLWNVIKIYVYEFPQYIRHKKLIRETLDLIGSLYFAKKKKFIKGYNPYGGWAWWTLTYECSKYLLNTYRQNPKFKHFFKYSWTPDEMVYQTILLNSPFKNNIVNDDLREISFKNKENSHPKIYSVEDYELIKNSDKFFARKFDMNIDSKILDMIDKELIKT